MKAPQHRETQQAHVFLELGHAREVGRRRFWRRSHLLLERLVTSSGTHLLLESSATLVDTLLPERSGGGLDDVERRKVVIAATAIEEVDQQVRSAPAYA